LILNFLNKFVSQDDEFLVVFTTDHRVAIYELFIFIRASIGSHVGEALSSTREFNGGIMILKKLFMAFAIVGILSLVSSADAQIVLFDIEGKAGSGLLPGNENPSVTESSSGGELGSGVRFDVGLSRLFINVGWGSANGFTDLTGDASAMHIHGAADFISNAGVKFGFNGLSGFDASASSGGFDGFVDVTDSGDIADLMAGRFYVNVHTGANGGGELRGNLVAVPEPTSFALLAVSGLALVARRRRRA